MSGVDVPDTRTDQVIDLADLVGPASSALGGVLLHDPGGPQECLVRSGEVVVLRGAASVVRNRLRHLIESIVDEGFAIRILLRAGERSRCVEIAASVGAAPNHVHVSCPIMIGTSRPLIGKRLPPAAPVAETVALLDTPPSGTHGSLVASVLAQQGVTTRHTPVLTVDGFGTDVALARGLRSTPGLALVASGTYTFDDRCPPVLASALSGPVVAAAGNGGSARPWWPAASSSVIAVGALGAPFSGTGPWVDEWESGVDVPGSALCTGTSFAAAVHAARLIRRSS